jgi:hypothetical protein
MTSTQTEFQETFAHLKVVLTPYAPRLICTEETPEHFSLDTPYVMQSGKHLDFGSVQIRKRYVSFHLMPVYVDPSLLDGISDSLRKRMQGKSCFNFKAVDKALFDELSNLVKAGHAMYRKEGYLKS